MSNETQNNARRGLILNRNGHAVNGLWRGGDVMKYNRAPTFQLRLDELVNGSVGVLAQRHSRVHGNGSGAFNEQYRASRGV